MSEPILNEVSGTDPSTGLSCTIKQYISVGSGIVEKCDIDWGVRPVSVSLDDVDNSLSSQTVGYL